jgi:hypothetical protein
MRRTSLLVVTALLMIAGGAAAASARHTILKPHVLSHATPIRWKPVGTPLRSGHDSGGILLRTPKHVPTLASLRSASTDQVSMAQALAGLNAPASVFGVRYALFTDTDQPAVATNKPVYVVSYENQCVPDFPGHAPCHQLAVAYFVIDASTGKVMTIVYDGTHALDQGGVVLQVPKVVP